MFPFLGGLASGALGLVGSMMNTSAQNNINQQMLQMQQNQNQWTNSEWQQSFAAANAQNQFSNAFNTAQYDEQDWLARNGISARVADAKAAGISPLAALGNPGIGSPSVAIQGGSLPSPGGGGVPNLTAPQPGAGVAALGQDISRALQATQDPEDRAVAVEKTRQDLEKGDLENALLKNQVASSAVARHGADQTGPGISDLGISSKNVGYWQLAPLDKDSFKVLPSKEASAADWASHFEKSRYDALTAGNFLRSSQMQSVLDRHAGGHVAGKTWHYDPITASFYRGDVNPFSMPGQNGDRLRVGPPVGP